MLTAKRLGFATSTGAQLRLRSSDRYQTEGVSRRDHLQDTVEVHDHSKSYRTLRVCRLLILTLDSTRTASQAVGEGILAFVRMSIRDHVLRMAGNQRT